MKRFLFYFAALLVFTSCTKQLQNPGPDDSSRHEDHLLIQAMGYDIDGIVDYQDGAYLIEGDIWILPENLQEWQNDTVATRLLPGNPVQAVDEEYQRGIYLELLGIDEYRDDILAAIEEWNRIEGCNILFQTDPAESSCRITLTQIAVPGEELTLIKTRIPLAGRPGNLIQVNGNCFHKPVPGSEQAKYMFMHALGHTLGFAHAKETAPVLSKNAELPLTDIVKFEAGSIMAQEPLNWNGFTEADKKVLVINYSMARVDAEFGSRPPYFTDMKYDLYCYQGGYVEYPDWQVVTIGPNGTKYHYPSQGGYLSISFPLPGKYIIHAILYDYNPFTGIERELGRKRLEISVNPQLSSGDYQYMAADFDGDGKDDLWFKDNSGNWYIDFAANGFGKWDKIIPNCGDDTFIPLPADYDGDGKADLAVKGNDGYWRIDYAHNGFGAWDAQYPGYGNSLFVPVPADYDGDGKVDLATKSDIGYWSIDYAVNGFGTWDVQFQGYGANSIFTPVPADYDGDGKADFATKSYLGVWSLDYARNGFGAWDDQFGGYGDSSYSPVPGDYDGDGKADIATMGSDGYWRIDYARNGFGAWDQTVGVSTDPGCWVIPGDYDGDGKTDIAIVLFPQFEWYIDYAVNGFGYWDVKITY